MAVEQLIRTEQDGSLSFGNHTLAEKAKLEDYKYGGDLMKVKTHKPMTKLEKNGLFVYESVPGTSVYNFVENEDGVSFKVEGAEDAQIIIGLEENAEYEVIVGGNSSGVMATNMGGKLSLNVELGEAVADIVIKKA
ncbi:MAG: endosialidase [Lachnospiraceae bacterium]|nr:endosialidase [Candidatus Colinaster scatohippi]